MMGSLVAFRGFDTANPQHLSWLKRKLHNKERYERKQARRASGSKSSRIRPYHLQSRVPALSIWWRKVVSLEHNAISGRPIYKSRLEWWNEVRNAR